VSTGRLQQFRLPMVGARWALLPTAAVTLDPLHSGGIAHGLAGVERLAALLLQNPLGDRLHRGLADYQQDVVTETRLLDRLIASSYHALHDFERFTASTMLYFAAAIRCEEARAAGTVPRRLWSADDPAFADLTRQTLTELRHTLRPGPAATAAWIERLRAALAPWNSAGLLDPGVRNRYQYTAALKPAAE
jgi:FADH2 O2-dependent halogenase